MSNTNELFFDPVKLSLEENAWLLEHLGEPWVVAGRTIQPERLSNPSPRDKNPINYPNGVNPNAVRPIVDRVYSLIELEKHEGNKWAGVEALKVSINSYLTQAQRWKQDKRKGAPRFPSLSSYDTKGRPHLNGPGSDSGQVRTYFDSDGQRQHFRIEYVPSGQGTWVAEWAEKVAEVDQPVTGLRTNKELRRIECFCGHTEQFNPDSRASYNAARARISKHLRSDKVPEYVEQHRQLHTDEFGGR